jgi:hypothetical protein
LGIQHRRYTNFVGKEFVVTSFFYTLLQMPKKYIQNCRKSGLAAIKSGETAGY